MTIQQVMIAQGITGGPPPSVDWAVPTYSTSDGNTETLTERLGWSFTVTGGDLSVTNLRVITGLTLSTSSIEDVRIHRNSDDALMAQASISVSALNTYFDDSITPVILVDGVTYTVSSRALGESRNLRRTNTRTFSSRVTVVTAGLFGSDDNRPTGVSGNTYQFVDFGYEP